MAFTLPGCPDVEGLNTKIADLEKKSADHGRQVKEMADQLRILNDEHNTMKQLVSQISTTVLEQKDAVEKLNATVSASASRKSAPTAAPSKGKPASKKRR
jgi:TolA-binding protein